MKHFAFALVIPCLTVFAGPVVAASTEKAPDTAVSKSLPSPAERLDKLFSELKRARDADEAKSIASRIKSEWTDSGSASINVLIQWADKAMSEKKNAVALDLLEQVIYLAPDYVEGWNRRATLHYVMGSYRKSMADINQVLAIEPRHFGAIAGMAAILTAAGEDELALRAWERFLDVYPAERKAQEELRDLTEKIAGSRT